MSLNLAVGYPKAEISSGNAGNDLKYWLWLQDLKSLTLQKKRELLETFGSPKTIFHLTPEQLGLDCTKLKKGLGTSFDSQRLKQLARADCMAGECIAQDVGILTCDDYRYRSMVRGYPLAPLLLFYRGKLGEPIRPVVNLVADTVDPHMAIGHVSKVCSYYSQRGYVIAIGLSFGCGTRLIERILDYSDTVIAFCCGGLDRCYPLENYHVLERIVEKGALFSAQGLGVAPSAHRSVQRDRLLGNWSDETVVLGSPHSIGTRSSLRYAFEVGRGVYKAEDLGRMDPYSSVAESPLSIGSAPIGSDDAALGSYLYELLQHVTLTTADVAESLHVGEERALGLLMDMELCGSVEVGSDGRWQVRHSVSSRR